MKALLSLALMVSAGAALADDAKKPAPGVALFKTADSAACAPDIAVWVDPVRRLYYVKGDPQFRNTKPGGWNCRKHVEAAGYQPGKGR